MAKGYEIEGALRVIEDLQTFASGFSKREFVIEVPDGKYPQMIKFETIKDKTGLIEKFKVGDELKVSFDIRGSEYNGRYYVNLNAWKVEKGGGAESSAPAAAFDGDGPPPSYLSEPPAGFDNSEDGSPF